MLDCHGPRGRVYEKPSVWVARWSASPRPTRAPTIGWMSWAITSKIEMREIRDQDVHHSALEPGLVLLHVHRVHHLLEGHPSHASYEAGPGPVHRRPSQRRRKLWAPASIRGRRWLSPGGLPPGQAGPGF